MNTGAWRRSLLGRGVDVLRRSTPRLQRLYADLPASAGLAPDASPTEHEQRLLRYYTFLRDHTRSLPQPPRFSLIMRDGPGGAETVASLQLQLWDDWELIRPPGAPRVNLPATRIQPAPPAGDFVIELDAGDRLYPNALSEMVRAIDMERRLTGDTPLALYSDERTIDGSGGMSGDPIFKPGFSPASWQAAITSAHWPSTTGTSSHRSTASPPLDGRRPAGQRKSPPSPTSPRYSSNGVPSPQSDPLPLRPSPAP